MNRREFLMGAGASLAALLSPGILEAAAAADGFKVFNPKRIRIEIGLGKPLRVLHLSDTHLPLMTEGERARPLRDRLFRERSRCWAKAERSLAEAVVYAKRENLPILHTGDLIDFLGEANVARAAEFAADPSVYAVAGNHEWCYFMYTRREEQGTIQEMFRERLDRAYRNDLEVSSRIIGGINFVGFDDWTYQVNERQDAFIRAEFAKGLPTVILCHCPFYTPKLHENELVRHKGRLSGLIGIPPELHAKIVAANPSGEKWRVPTERTNAFFRWIAEQPNFKAVLSGHVHHYHAEPFAERVPQYVTSAHANGFAQEVLFV